MSYHQEHEGYRGKKKEAFTEGNKGNKEIRNFVSFVCFCEILLPAVQNDLPTLKAQLACRERPAGRPALRMRWENLLFLHWAWDAADIQKTLPPGLRVDVFEGQAWLGVVPFFMRRVHPVGLPCVPWLSDFLELNVRTYVYDETGTPGVWFYSLACNQPVAVEIARRFFHLNYVHAAIQAAVRDGGMEYQSRRHAEVAVYDYAMDGPAVEAVPGTLEFFLLERYVLFSTNRGGRIHSGRVHHAPYQFAPARVKAWSFLPAGEDGFADPGRSPDHMHFSPGVDVAAWPIKSA